MPATPDEPEDLLTRLQGMAPPASSSGPADLLAALNSGPTPKRKAADDEEELDETVTGFRARAKREQERYLAATDSEYWCAPCFWTAQAHAAFVAALPVPAVDSRWIDGLELAAALDIPVDPEQAEPEEPEEVDVLAALQALAPTSSGMSSEDLLAQLQADALPDPLAGIEYTGNLAVDSLAELTTLAAALRAADERCERGRLVTDSPFWVVLWFPLRAHKDAFLKAINMLAFGDKYIDGHRLADVLDIELPAAPPADTEGR
ncbi:hypothetical protein FKR81_32425 [Lentzea tibetensis]|uniref:Uncharacterized protein n=1 Tax=Lentzea tibetensis TaxID=2591470 RepID=A0A563EKL5_9PSEU|nr:hypothetical protein [Lentzea tibetensis]TWP47421.1 hypothetical protein FKR81_32425 [Lentzea tibetensis]